MKLLNVLVCPDLFLTPVTGWSSKVPQSQKCPPSTGGPSARRQRLLSTHLQVWLPVLNTDKLMEISSTEEKLEEVKQDERRQHCLLLCLS